jgi:hypothetical protein
MVQGFQLPEEQIGQRFDRFRLYDAAGDYDRAFAELARGNALKNAGLDAASDLDRIDVAVRALIAGPPIEAKPSNEAPIFIIGMPRSGSTLVEQILAAHPDVTALGESADLAAALLTNPQSAASEYLSRARARGWYKGRLVDKSLTNHMHVSAINALFPRATIIHTVRESADISFSCYSINFGNDMLMSFSYDLRNIGRRFRLYREIMNHWGFALMGRVAQVRYEALARDPERETRALLQACGLPWDDRCLRFYENDRKVETASADQVRRPIFTDSIGRWRNYERHLGPLFEALGPYAPT